ncbi:MAG: restriction endonuclease [Treponema sp.]|nr:restriction endonuclease [Treponema sp.]
MAIPDFQTIMLPLLRYAADRQEHKVSDAVTVLSNEFKLTEEERQQMIPSNRQATMYNRVVWAKTYLKNAGLLSGVRRGFFQITERGNAALAENPARIDMKYLNRFEEFKTFRTLRHEKETTDSDNDVLETQTPDDLLAEGYKRVSENLVDEVLEKILACSPKFFENLVVDLLVRMGYGGSFDEASSVVGKSGDEGIDGIIKEDRLGFDAIYIQAKRWQGAVGRPEIQKFAGALLGQKANKGVFITTSIFSKEAVEYAKTVNQKIVLIDGQKLASLMIEHNVGISVMQTYEIKRIDSDYFEE